MKNLKFPNLFSPLRFGNTMLKNRIMSSPAGVPNAKTPSSTHYGSISAYDRSLGGAGLVIDPIYGCGLDLDPFSKYGADSTREILSVLRQSGAIVGYPTDLSFTPAEDGKILYPVDGLEKWFRFNTRMATPDDLHKYADNCGKLAKKIKDFGFDTTMLCFGGESMVGLMLSKWNTRTDEYGGSLENKTRWAVEYAKAVREAVGPDFPIIARVGRTLGPIEETYSEEESLFMCKQIAPYIDLFVTCNGMDTYGKVIEHYECNVHGQTTVFEPKEYNLAWASKVRKETGKPIYLNGGVNGSPEEIEKWIADGLIDGVSMARQLFADPFWAKKAEEGRDEDIVPCLRCNNCYHISTVHQNVQCSVNPRFRRENRVPLKMEKTDKPKNVVVVGGGPAGIRAALWADEKGHNVTLIEKTDKLGGLINFCDYGKYKKELKNFRDYLLVQINKSNVKVMLNTFATKELIDSLNPDGLIIATGSKPIVPNIKGIENATGILDVYPTLHELKGKTVIIGAGSIGCEAALELGEDNKEVVLIGRNELLAPKENWLYRIALRQHLAKCENLTQMLQSEVVEIQKGKVIVRKADGSLQEVQADNILIALGMQSNKEEAFALYGVTPNTQMIGDCHKVGHVLDCTNDAYFAAVNI